MSSFTERFLALQPYERPETSMALFIELLVDVTGLSNHEVKEKLSFLLQDVVERYGEEVSETIQEEIEEEEFAGQIYIMNRSQKPSEFIKEYLANLSRHLLPKQSKIPLRSGKEVRL